MTQTWPGLLSALLAGQSLSTAETAWAMREIMSGDATPAQTAGFVVALRAKGETLEEVSGFVEVMIEEATPARVEGRVVDTCGTGGDRSNTVNISTMAAIVVAGAGVPVAKHGGRAASSACGSADLRGGDAATNAAAARKLLAGGTGAVRDAVVLNAAAALAAYDASTGSLESRLGAGLARAAQSLDSGGAATALDRWVEVSQRLRP